MTLRRFQAAPLIPAFLEQVRRMVHDRNEAATGKGDNEPLR